MIWLLAVFALASCQKHSQWQKQTISENKSAVTRTIHRTQNPTQGIDVEILQTDGEFTVYLQVFSEIPEGKARLTINRKKSFSLIPHKGGQRFSLDEAAKEALLTALKEGEMVAISLCGYEEILQPSNFDRKESSVLKKIRLY